MVHHRWNQVAGFLAVACVASVGCSGDSANESATSSSPPNTQPLPATTQVATTTTTEVRLRRLSTIFSGDILVHSSIWKRAAKYAGGNGYDFVPIFAEIEPLVSSVDLAVCHLETPIVSPGQEPQTYPRYAAPFEILAGITSAGYDRCSTASNHSMDQGVNGVIATVDAFAAAGITQAGIARDAADAVPDILDVSGIKVAHLSYSYTTGWIQPPDGEPWWANELDTDRIIADARSARDLGAEVVILSLHWGVEPSSRLSRAQLEQSDVLTASGVIDLIVGHHAHVVQPIQQVNGVWTVFGMGNSLSNMPVGPYPPQSQDGVLVQVDFEVSPDGEVTVQRPVVYPTRVDKGYSFAIKDVLTELARPDLTARQRVDFGTTLRRVSSIVGEFVATAPFHAPAPYSGTGPR